MSAEGAIRRIKQFTLWVPDKPGELGEVATALWERQVNIEAFLASSIRKGQAAIHVVVDKPALARKIFADHGWKVTEEDIGVVALRDKPGTLATAVTKLGRAGINIRYAYMGPFKGRGSGKGKGKSKTRSKGRVNTYLAVSDLAGAVRVLRFG